MTNLPPPDPESFPQESLEPSPPSRQPSRRRAALGFKELVGVFIAFSTIGTIFAWSFTQEEGGFDLANLLPVTPVPPRPTVTPSPSPAVSPSPVTPIPTPGESPTSLTPAPITSPTAPAVPAPTAPAPTQPVGFSDVPNDFWAYPFIAALSQRGIITGFRDGTFRPNQPVTRAEFATFIQEAFEQNPTPGGQVYKDIPSNFWAASAIDGATRTQFMRGYPGDVFRPSQQIPRVQTLASLVSGLGLAPQSPIDQTLRTYVDADQIPKWATDKVAAATETGLVVNYPEQQSLRPNENATRADAAAFIYQALAQAGQAEKIASEYIVQPK